MIIFELVLAEINIDFSGFCLNLNLKLCYNLK